MCKFIPLLWSVTKDWPKSTGPSLLSCFHQWFFFIFAPPLLTTHCQNSFQSVVTFLSKSVPCLSDMLWSLCIYVHVYLLGSHCTALGPGTPQMLLNRMKPTVVLYRCNNTTCKCYWEETCIFPVKTEQVFMPLYLLFLILICTTPLDFFWEIFPVEKHNKTISIPFTHQKSKIMISSILHNRFWW